MSNMALLLLNPDVGVHYIQFRRKELGNRRPRALVVDGYGLANIVHKETWTNGTASSKFTPTSNFFEMN